MNIPSWLIQIGSLTGLVTFCYTIWDRLLAGRPLVSIRLSEYHREVFCRNLSHHDVVVTKIECIPDFVMVAANDSIRGVVAAAAGNGFAAVLKPEEDRGFPIIFRKGELVDRESTTHAPFVIIVSWRRTRSTWLPQMPAVIFSSAKTMRLLESAK
jgi:hypothetical protein